MVDNIENLTISCDWDGQIEVAKINAIKEEFECIVQEKDNTFTYVSVENVKTYITNVMGLRIIDRIIRI